MSENYIVINGNRVDLTEEQVKALGTKVKVCNPYQRVFTNTEYWAIDCTDGVTTYTELGTSLNDRMYHACNYFTNSTTATQVALHQLLYRKLLKFAYDNDCTDLLPWNGDNYHYEIEKTTTGFTILGMVTNKSQNVYFSSEEGAKLAITKVIEPFMKEHPKFEW